MQEQIIIFDEAVLDAIEQPVEKAKAAFEEISKAIGKAERQRENQERIRRYRREQFKKRGWK